MSESFDRQASKALGKKIHGRSKHCWNNALRGMAALQRKPDHNVLYVEGYVNNIAILAEHAWLEADGKIIDPTPAFYNSKEEPDYFPGVRYTREQLSGIMRIGSNVTLPFFRFHGTPETNEQMKAAHDECHRALFGMTMAEAMEKLDSMAGLLARHRESIEPASGVQVAEHGES